MATLDHDTEVVIETRRAVAALDLARDSLISEVQLYARLGRALRHIDPTKVETPDLHSHSVVTFTFLQVLPVLGLVWVVAALLFKP